MSEAAVLAKLIVTIGVVAALAVSLYGSSGPAFPFQVNFPTFSNPFDASVHISTYSFLPTVGYGPGGNGTGDPAMTVDLTGCSIGWDCIRDLNGSDGASSYATLHNVAVFNTPPAPCNFNDPNSSPDANCRTLPFYLEGSGLKGEKLVDITVDIWCRTRNTTSPVRLQVSGIQQFNSTVQALMIIFTGQQNDVMLCPVGAFGHLSIRLARTGISGDTSAWANPLLMTLWMFDQGNAPWIDVSTVRMQGTYQTTTTGCASSTDFFTNIGCHLGAVGDASLRTLQLLVNIVVYIGQWLLAFITIMANVFVAASWFFNIPGLPTVVQNLLDAFFIGTTTVFILIIVRTLRGGGGA